MFRKLSLIILMSIIFLNACTKNNVKKDAYKYVVGVSVPNVREPWIASMSEEISTFFLENDVNVIYKDSAGDDKKQIADIKSLINSGVDLLIIIPQKSFNLAKEIELINNKIPIIIAGSDPLTDKYLCFIHFDDYGIGKELGEYAINNYSNENFNDFNLVVLEGPKDSLISLERLRGFNETVAQKMDTKNITYFYGDWLRDKAEDRVKDYLIENESPNIIISFNDEMAYGAYIASNKLKAIKPLFIGVGGFESEHGGKNLVDLGILDATIRCPGFGSLTAKTALKILKGETVPDKISLKGELYIK